jgi:hypothetical protein
MRYEKDYLTAKNTKNAEEDEFNHEIHEARETKPKPEGQGS